MSRSGKRLLGLVNPRTPDGELKDPVQVWNELQAQMAAKREAGSDVKDDEKQDENA